MPMPPEVGSLIERFDRNRDVYRTGNYNETQVRREFIDPLFTALGWDVENRQGYAEAYKDVIHEDAIKIGGETKAPDYSFRVGGTRKFFLEAKRPSVNIKEDPHPAYQLRRYGWSAKLPLSVLTDFEEFAIYDCRVKPDQSDRASTARIFYTTYSEYSNKWNEISDVFGRDSLLRGSFDKFAESSKQKRGTIEVDDAFLTEIEAWREVLAKNIAVRNRTISARELNIAVQLIIDRIVFLRMCEDRGIEAYGQLRELCQGQGVYQKLVKLFEKADDRYNSGLFYFSPEKERPEIPDRLTPGLAIDDRALAGILKSLYYPSCPYEFSVIPTEILGHVYERFLGKVISLTTSHNARIEDKPEVRKAGGVYYTPTYIVEDIVRRTLAPIFAGKTPKQAELIRIVDPSCGSGSFLIGAYNYLLDWYLRAYLAEGPANHISRIFEGVGGSWKLAPGEKKRILLNSIFGVDVDAQAVEVTKLSLFLKVLEDESGQSLATQLRMFRERALPDLGNNVKCGNALIGSDFYRDQDRQRKLFDADEQYRINAFDWNDGFPWLEEVGGFDAVIGNPPWGADFSSHELAYLRSRHARVINRMIDSYIYFIDKSTQVVKSDGAIGFIIPSTILNQSDATAVRRVLLDRGLTTLISLGQDIFGKKPLNTSTVFISATPSDDAGFSTANLSELPLAERKTALSSVPTENWRDWQNLVESDPHLTFFVGNSDDAAMLNRLRVLHGPLEQYLVGAIERGVSPDIASAHVIPAESAEAMGLEPTLLRRSVSGSQIRRYHNWHCDQYLIYTSRETIINRYPATMAHLESFRHLNTCKEVIQGKHPWWALHRPRNPQIFASPKFIGLTTSKTIEIIYDDRESACVTDAMYVFRMAADQDPWACMTVFHSELFLRLYRIANQGESRVIPQVKASKLQTLPFPSCDIGNPIAAELGLVCRELINLVSQSSAARTAHEAAFLKRQYDAADRTLNELVLHLYQLTENEAASLGK